MPPYLFKQDGSHAARPVIAKAPRKISYRGHFEVEVAGDPRAIASVVLLRSDHNTHSLTTGDRYVKLAFQAKRDDDDGELRVRAPKLPAQAVPGFCMLLVEERECLASDGRPGYLKPGTEGTQQLE